MSYKYFSIKIKIIDTKGQEKLPDQGSKIKKGTAHIIVEPIEYEYKHIMSKSIMKRATGAVNALSFASDDGLNEKIPLLIVIHGVCHQTFS